MRGGTTKTNFGEAAKHEHELNDRQREVLRLVAEGLTNAEIGERLGMTLYGAKWNVSEILSKLGLASREEAAEYWRWRHGGVWSRVRALFGAPLAKVAGAGAAAVVGVVVVAALLSEDEPPVEDVPGRPFYLEAEYRLTTRARSIGTNVTGADEVDESAGVIRWWWQDADHFRVEYDLEQPASEAGKRIMVGDGQTEWTYLEADGVYTKRPLMPVPEGYPVRPITMSLLIGALPLGDHVDTVDEFIETFTGWQGVGRGWAKVVGEESYMGRPVTVVEMGPVGCSYTQTRDSTGATVQEEECSGTSRLWLDVERMLVLRHTAEDDTQSFDARVTKLDYDARHPGERFRFEPPPGAREEDDSPDDDRATTAPVAPPGFLQLDTPPAGYRWQTATGTRGTTDFYAASLEGPDGAGLRIVQRRAPLSEEMRGGSRYVVHGVMAYGKSTASGGSRLAWEEAGVMVVIEADALSVEELVAVAESMRLVE